MKSPLRLCNVNHSLSLEILFAFIGFRSIIRLLFAARSLRENTHTLCTKTKLRLITFPHALAALVLSLKSALTDCFS